MIITNVLADWLFILEANKKGKYGMCCILKDDDPQVKLIEAELDKQKAKGIAKGLFTEANTKSKTFMKCLRNGTEECETEDRPKHYMGCMFFNANSQTTPPGIVGPDTQPLMSKEGVHSGSYFNVDINFYPYAHPDGGKGIACGLNNVMFVKAGDRLDGRQDAATAFEGMATTDNLE
jgi:hypothetical protein